MVSGEGNSDPRSAPVPQLGSAVRTAGEGGRVSPGAQAQPLSKITSLVSFHRVSLESGTQGAAESAGENGKRSHWDDSPKGVYL